VFTTTAPPRQISVATMDALALKNRLFIQTSGVSIG
jgi:hypothetical protein